MATTRIGVELELWTLDEVGNLVRGGELPAVCEGVESEFADPLLEVKTSPCDSPEAVRNELLERLEGLLSEAKDRGKRLVPLGTPLGEADPSMDESTRTDVQRAILGDDLRHAAHCAGTHVHFEQSNPPDQLRLLTALDPAFALLNTAPYYRGERIATCARPHVYRRRCYSAFPELGRLWRYPESVAEWRERRGERFESFVEAAREAGFDPGTVEDAFSPTDAVWSPVRLRDDLGTVEWRAPDAAPLGEVLRLVADLDRLMDRSIERGTLIGDEPAIETDPVRVPPFEEVLAHTDAAMKDGLSSDRVREYLRRLGFDPAEYRPVGARIDGLDRLDPERVRRIRLEYADRLEREVDQLRRGAVDDESAALV